MVNENNNQNKEQQSNDITMEQVVANIDALNAEGKNVILNRGSIITGTIVKITNDTVYVNIDQKSEGMIPLSDFTDLDEKPEIGAKVSAMVIKPEDKNGDIVLSKKRADAKVAWDELLNCHSQNKPIKAKIVKQVKGGYEAYFKGIRCFVPSSQIDKRVVKPNECIGNTYEFKILDINKTQKSAVISHKAITEAIEKEKLDKIFENLKEGSVVTGTIKSFTEYGAFIDIGGIDGLLHITDISYGHVSNPVDVLPPIGSQITCKVLKASREEKKVSLGLKQLNPNPWETIEQKYKIGDVCECVVKNITEFGIFVTLEPGVDGLIHISDLSWSGKVKPSDFKQGQKISAKITEINLNDKKIKLSIKHLTKDPWQRINELYPVNSIVTGKVKSIVSFGMFIELEEGIEGFVHISNLSWTKKVNNPSEMFKVGDVVEAKVLEVDAEKKKIALGIKQTKVDPWTLVETKYKVDQIVEGKISNIKNFGVFIELEEGIEGLLHVSDISWNKKIDNPSEMFKIGDKIKVKIIEINPTEKRIALSYKHLTKDPWHDIDLRLQVGSKIKGRITHFASFGAFIEVEEGIEGLLHISDISWTKKYSHPSDALKEGDIVEVVVLNIDKENHKISLGMKQLTRDPLILYKEKMDSGEFVEGKVKSIQEYGAFVELEEGIEGLLHISQLSDERVERVEQVVKVGQIIKVKIIEVNLEERKIKLSMRPSVVLNNNQTNTSLNNKTLTEKAINNNNDDDDDKPEWKEALNNYKTK